MTDNSERKEAEPIETTEMSLDIRDASPQGHALMKERVENQKKMLAIAINLTSPNQWVIFAGDGKESIYPTGGAADTILRRAFGLTWGDKTITVEETPDGRLATCGAWLLKDGEKLEHFVGYRMMGGYTKTEPDLRKGALENLKSVAVRDLLGLRFRTPAELKEMGLDIDKLERRAEFQSHDKDPNTITVPFGRDAGKPITEVDDKALVWLGDAVRKSVDDPKKAKWKKKNQALLDALLAEHARRRPSRRHPAKDEEKKEEAPTDHDYGPPPYDEREPGEDG